MTAAMQYFDAYLMLATLEESDRATMPPGLQVITIRTPPPPGKPETGVIFFGETSGDGLARILEAIWLDRRVMPRAETERRLFLLGDAVYLQIGDGEKIQRVSEPGPIRGAIEGFRSHLQDLLDQLEKADIVAVETPLGTRTARYLDVRLPDPAAGAGTGAGTGAGAGASES